MRSIKLSSALAAAAALLAFVPAGAAARIASDLHSGPRACRVSVFAEPHVITSGETAELFGGLVCPRRPAASIGQPVTALAHSAGVPGMRTVGTTTTGSGGGFTLSTGAIATDTAFYVKVGTARTVRRLVRVAPLVTLAASGLSDGATVVASSNHVVLFSGIVSPADAGAEVLLEREAAVANEEWFPIQRTAVRGDGSYSLLHHFVVPGAANLRVIVRPHGLFDVRGTSNTLSLEVTGRQNPRLTIFTSADPVSFGQPITITGVLAGGANQKVTLLSRTHGDNTPFVKAGETTTDGSGNYKFALPAMTANATFKVTNGKITSALLLEGVKYLVNATASAKTVQEGQAVTFAGAVVPGDAGKLVYLERENAFGGSFHVVDLTTVVAGGTYSIPYFAFGSGRQVYRVKVPGDPGNQGAATTTFTIEVTPPPPGTLVRPEPQPRLPR
jgi:hypothetical protein